MKLKSRRHLKRQINKPEYFYNPKQVWRRLIYRNQQRNHLPVSLNSGKSDFFVNENEVIGRSILTMGVYDLVVAETIKRIIKSHSVFWDVGANIGYFSRLAADWGAEIMSFEPHPRIFKRLSENLKYNSKENICNFALSDKSGEFKLYVPRDFKKNEGIASLEPIEGGQEVIVQTKTIDELPVKKIDLMKVDVEGHELKVFKGARNTLKEKRISHILFEDFNGAQSESIEFLKMNGYTVKGLLKTLRRPKLLTMAELNQQPTYEPANFIASLDSTEQEELFAQSGWAFYQK